MTDSPADADATAHEWISFVDDDGDTWMFDLTFLTSNWTCIYGRGCPGILSEPAPENVEGCCSYGAHFTGEEDLQRVAEAASRLDDSTWQYRAESIRRGGPFKKAGDATVSRLVGDSCIFLNRPGFENGPGCALHQGAVAAGERPLDWKPEVCWQVPLRLVEHVDENDRTTRTLREWQRRDWGPGGDEFHWWCTDAPDAFVGSRPVYREMQDEIIEMVGADLYDRLSRHLDTRTTEVRLPHPALKKHH
ncbi:MAG: hypothetical protein ACXIVQ_01500 [Acidimicrobiales bacterium]